MRKLVNSSSYGDVTDGKTALKKIAATDNDLHFYTIAELYMVDGSSEIVTADRMHIRVQTVQSKIMFDAMITVNLNNETDKFTVNLLAENYDKGFVPFEDYSQIENAIHPQLRIVYNDDDTFTSGVLLQLGIEFKGFVEETVVIEDLSGKESCWLLLDGSTTAVPPEDNSIELPNGTAVYDETNPDSTAISTLVPFKGGFIAWAGSVSLNRPDGGYKVTEFEHYIPENVDLTKISHARLELQEGDDTLFPVRVDFIPGSDDMTGLGHFMYNSEAAYANLRIWNDVDGIKMTLSSDVDRTASATPLDLKHVFIFTD